MSDARRSHRGGFTLIEILMVVAIFSMAVLMSTDVFLTANRSQRHAQSQQRVQADARFTIETIAREIRSSIPDYALYADPNRDGNFSDVITLAEPKHVLALCDADNLSCDYNKARTIFRQVSTGLTPWSGGGTRLEICTTACDDSGSWSDITPEGVTLVNFKAFVTPSEDPFTLSNTCSQDVTIPCTDDIVCNIGNSGPPNRCLQYRSDTQPSVTVILTLREEAQGGVPSGADQVYQTTVTSRLFLR